MKLSAAHKRILLAIAAGHVLKAHRDIEGGKVYKLHPLRGEPRIINGDDVQRLCDEGLIDSNKKFPAATFWLTEKGKTLVAQITENNLRPSV